MNRQGTPQQTGLDVDGFPQSAGLQRVGTPQPSGADRSGTPQPSGEVFGGNNQEIGLQRVGTPQPSGADRSGTPQPSGEVCGGNNQEIGLQRVGTPQPSGADRSGTPQPSGEVCGGNNQEIGLQRVGTPQPSGADRSGTPQPSGEVCGGNNQENGLQRVGTPQPSGADRSGTPQPSGEVCGGNNQEIGLQRVGTPQPSGADRSGTPQPSGEVCGGNNQENGLQRVGTPQPSGADRSGTPQPSGEVCGGNNQEIGLQRVGTPQPSGADRSGTPQPSGEVCGGNNQEIGLQRVGTPQPSGADRSGTPQPSGEVCGGNNQENGLQRVGTPQPSGADRSGTPQPSLGDVSENALSRNQSRKSGKRARGDEWHADTRDPSTLNNAAWEAYYKGMVVPNEEWEAFAASMRSGLPMSVRINTAPAYVKWSDGVSRYLRGQLEHLMDVTCMPFFLPPGTAFQCDISRGNLKRNEAFRTIKKVIAALNEAGYLTRQETVSMLPPLLLDVKPGHRVLDMCAAPGSKTSQILEKLVQTSSPTAPDGVVVANDVNVSRIDVLHHQTNRAAGAHPHLIVTNYDATRFPLLPSADRFDRVLCDVMCSGDGTLRKSVDLWPRWNTLLGADLHVSQCRVLRRGMSLCKAGGIVVYSTCSINPVEDEAVVSACLEGVKADGGHFVLVDPEPLLPGLRYARGLTAWRLLTKDLSHAFTTFEEAKAFSASGKKFNFRPSMFADTALLQSQHIERTCRVLPHQQDTGGFFVAAMRCVSEVPWDATKGGEAAVAAAVGTSPLQAPSAALTAAVQRALRLPADFPMDRLVARNETKREQKLYLAHRATVELSHRLGARVVSVGGKVFEAVFKYSLDKFRFAPEGLPSLRGLLPPSFFLRVEPQFIVDLADRSGTMAAGEFATRTGLQGDISSLPPSFILQCTPAPLTSLHAAAAAHPQEEATPLDDLLISAEVMTNGNVLAKVQEWQATLCRLGLGLPCGGETQASPPAPAPKTHGFKLQRRFRRQDSRYFLTTSVVAVGVPSIYLSLYLYRGSFLFYRLWRIRNQLVAASWLGGDTATRWAFPMLWSHP
eukprot:gene2339-1470_t